MNPQSFFGFGSQPYSNYFPSSQFNDPTLQDRAYQMGQEQALVEDYDPTNPQSVTGLQRLVATGQVSPTAARAILPKTGRSGNLDSAHAQTSAEIFSIPWNSPDADQQVAQILQKNPSFAGTPQGASLLTSFQTHRRNVQPTTRNNIEMQLAQAGVDPDDFDQYRDKNGQIDPVRAAYAIGQQQRQAKVKDNSLTPSIKQRQGLVEAFQKLHTDPNDEEALSAYNDKHNTNLNPNNFFFSKPTPDQIAEGRQLAKQNNLQNLINTIDSMQQAGIRLPDALQKHLEDGSLMGGPAPQAQPQTAPDQTSVNTNKLPSSLLPAGAAGAQPVTPTPQAAPQPEAQTAPTDPFAQLAQAAQKKQQEKDAITAKNQKEDSDKWEKAKRDLITQHPEIFAEGINEPGQIEKKFWETLPEDKLNTSAFTDSDGNYHTYGEVISALSRDPRLQQIAQPKAPIANLPSGRKFTVGVPIKSP